MSGSYWAGALAHSPSIVFHVQERHSLAAGLVAAAEEIQRLIDATSVRVYWHAGPADDAKWTLLGSDEDGALVLLDCPAQAGDPTAAELDKASEIQDLASTATWQVWGLVIGETAPVVVGFEFAGGLPNEERTTVLRQLVAVLHAAIQSKVRAEVGPWRTDRRAFDIIEDWKTGEGACAVLFSDVRGFSTATDVLGTYAGHTVQVGNEALGLPDAAALFGPVCEALGNLAGYYGRIDKFMGDGILVTFDTTDYDTPGQDWEFSPEALCVARAVCTALHMCTAFEGIAEGWKAHWLPKFRKLRSEWLSFELGIGIEFGPVLKELVGPPWRSQYTVFGERVNQAKRLEEIACKHTQPPGAAPRAAVLVSAAVKARLDEVRWTDDQPLFKYGECRPEPLKGSGHDQEVWEVIGRETSECAIATRCLLCGSVNKQKKTD